MRRPHWGWQDPLEASLLPAVSAESLMAHARAIAAWERESLSRIAQEVMPAFRAQTKAA